MATGRNSEVRQANVISFPKRKLVPIEPELKSFLDDCLIPMLIRAALEEISQKGLENEPRSVADCGRHLNPTEVLR